MLCLTNLLSTPYASLLEKPLVVRVAKRTEPLGLAAALH